MDLDSVADELFGLPMGDFTTVRNERSKQARAGGDRDLAREIQQLRKPTTSAWLVNQLARHHTDQLEPLLELGRDLREAGAMLSGDDLRALTRQRHQVVHALVQVARRAGREEGMKVGDAVADEVRATLEASLADPDAADAVLEGRLTNALEQSGFGVVGAGGGAARPEPSSSSGQETAEVTDLDRHRRERAERRWQQAARAVEQAETSLQRAEQARDKAAEAQQSAEAAVDKQRAELDRAEDEAAKAAEATSDRQRDIESAQGRLDEARRAHEDARADLDSFDD